MIRVLGLKKKVRVDVGLPHNLHFLFQVENWLHEKGVNIEYLWRCAIGFLHFCFHSEQNYLLNENYWVDLGIIAHGRSKGNAHNCAYISSILGSILTSFRPQWWHRGRQHKCFIISANIRTIFAKLYRSDGNVGPATKPSYQQTLNM